MKLILRSRKNKNWIPIAQSKYSNESHLQELLEQSPDLIPTQDLSEGKASIKLAVRELPLPGSGYLDILGIDEFGNLYIVETKLAKNPEAKREVIGQILEYAAFLWGKKYDELDVLVKGKTGHTISEFFETHKFEEWEEESFRQTLGANLENGYFTLFIVIDEINDELRRVIEFLNHRLNIEIYALALRYFNADDSVEIMFPQVFGSKPVVSPGTRGVKEWDEEGFFKDAKAYLDTEALETLKALYAFAQEKAAVRFGTGTTRGSFTVQLTYHGRHISALEVTARGRIHFYLSGMANRGISREQLQQLVDRLTAVDESFAVKGDLERSYSSSYISTLTDAEKLKKLEAAILDFQASISG